MNDPQAHLDPVGLIFLGIYAVLISIYLIMIWKYDKDPCPMVYQGYDCDGKKCDHSERAWALLGINKEDLNGQPYRHEEVD